MIIHLHRTFPSLNCYLNKWNFYTNTVIDGISNIQRTYKLTNTWMAIAIRKLHSGFFTFSVVQTLYDDGSVHPLWLLWLAVALGILFLIMLIINIFLCSAMTCSCTRTDIIEKEPSIIEDYDPYRSWHGSQYGSRFDLITFPKRIAWLADKVSLLIASIIYDYE